ncbi:MAG: S1C family serine protease [Bacteroidota bacterium]
MFRPYLRSPWGVGLLAAAVFFCGVLFAPLLREGFDRVAEAAPVTAAYDRHTIANVAEAAAPAVVGITASFKAAAVDEEQDELFRWFFNFPIPRAQQPQERLGYGTGFIFRADGYILTNAHVVRNATKILVRLAGDDGEIPAKLVGRSNLLDLAVLKIETKKSLPTLPLGDSGKLRPGDWVVAIGNPLGYDHTVTAGVISATGRRGITAGGGVGERPHQYDELLQTDAAINPGNSGGPLLNLDGQVIGINAVVSAVGQGIGFAIPVNTARDALDQLIKTGRYSRPWIGVSIGDLAKVGEEIRAQYRLPAGEGVFIAGIWDGSPADREGLAKGDAITAVDGKPVRTADEFVRIIRARKVGDRVRLTVLHRGKTLEVELTLAEQPEENE